MRALRLFLIPAMCAQLLPLIAKEESVDGISGIVSAGVITRSEVEIFSLPATESLNRQYAGPTEEFKRKYNAALNDGLRQLIERRLILHSFENDGYRLPDSVIDEMVQERIRERYGDRITFMKSLQQQGLTLEQFRKQVREQYIESAMRNLNVYKGIYISPFKVEKYYLAHQDDYRVQDQVRLRTIALTKSSPTDINTLRLAQEIRLKISDGATFVEMANVHSQDSKQRPGGEWGWTERSILRKELADVAFTQPVNAISEVVDTPDTCYLVLVEDRKTAQVRPLTEVAGDIEKLLRTQEQARLQKKWIATLEKRTLVRVLN